MALGSRCLLRLFRRWGEGERIGFGLAWRHRTVVVQQQGSKLAATQLGGLAGANPSDGQRRT